MATDNVISLNWCLLPDDAGDPERENAGLLWCHSHLRLQCHLMPQMIADLLGQIKPHPVASG